MQIGSVNSVLAAFPVNKVTAWP